MPAHHQQPIFQSGDCEIDIARRELRISGAAAPLGARAMEILEVLVGSGSTLITKENLAHSVWPGALVPDNTIQVHIAAIRKALGPHRALLKTESGRGYRLVGDWAVRQEDVTAKAIEANPPQTAGEPPPTNFPAPAFGLIGRANTVKQLQELLSAYRAVTLTGPGGIGKTVLALEVARTVLSKFRGGGWVAELASLSDPHLVLTVVSAVLDLRLASEAISAEGVAQAIGQRHLLLVLDNCEHVIDAAAGLAETVLRLCPHATVLATSREVLRIGGEYVYRVPPLEVPPPDQDRPDDLLRHSAVELFVARTRAQVSNFAPDPAGLSAIAAICRHLDGIPLAIEFAAARTATLGLPQVAAMLEDRFRLLTGGRRTALPRHQTLRAALDWSYDLLPESEQSVLRHLAVFPAGFTTEAAAAVMKDVALDPSAVTEGIANLVAKSLVILAKSDAVSRWYLLETIRAYALEKLVEHEEVNVAARHQAAYFLDLFAFDSEIGSRLSDDDLALRVREIDNVRAALDWSFSPAGDSALGIGLTIAYAPVWLNLSLMPECRERCERALLDLEPDATPNQKNRMWLQIALGTSLNDTMGHVEQARALLVEALETADALDDHDAQARALIGLMNASLYHGLHGRARAAVKRFGQMAERLGDPAVILVADRLTATMLLTIGKFREAYRVLERVLRFHDPPQKQTRSLWYPTGHRASDRAMLSRALWLRGFVEKAHHEALRSLDELGPSDPQLLICRVLYVGICRIAPMTGDFATAEQANARLIQVATSLNAQHYQTVGRFLEGKLMVERREFANGLAALRDAFDTCLRTGWLMSYPEYKCWLAQALLGLGQLDEALDAVEQGLEGSEQGEEGQRWYVPELLRIKGEILLQQKLDRSVLAAKDCFDQAGELAREQGALFWELRLALSVARWLVAEDQADAANKVLTPVYRRFTEGFDTADMLAAKALLDALPPDQVATGR